MIKGLMTSLFAVALTMLMSGCSTMHMGWTAVTGQHKLDDNAMEAYDNMFTKVVEYGDPARAMMQEWLVNADIPNDDVAETIKSLAEEYNMRVTGDIKMYTKDDAAPEEVKHARIFSLCSLPIAKVFLNHSRYYGGFMPCRIMLVEYGNGDRWLVSMDMTLAIHGGYELPEDMLKMALSVKKAMDEIPARAAIGDF
ncbi:DUF302 domain-containing protein [Sulfurimonas sp. HSL-3221]|uniref:DUF302 domain-containing protein n=1 Tax=Sulfurimonas diazotrophicus TaxID=3131939 RepID=A0ABZ3HAP4_9BACT|nr:DUF302 domain-containing protein [Sulfurimonas sp. HSL-3221]UFS63049.1 DUF302 domain-containing protein [Sulfurimonas sp. HSL-3221]